MFRTNTSTSSSSSSSRSNNNNDNVPKKEQQQHTKAPLSQLPSVTPSPSYIPQDDDDRRGRQEWIQQQLHDRKRRYEKDENDKTLEIEQQHARLWSPYVREAARTHELNLAWKQDKGFFSWDRVLSLTELEALRITGFALPTLPRELPASLSCLTTLSLIACQLEVLPDTIGLLVSLTELDLTKNNLRKLPDSITTLVNLTYLQLSSNLLDELPQNFGNLIHLDKLLLENNKLSQLPSSIAQCHAAHTANFNNNLLTSLPETIADMASLTQLSLNNNELVELPDALTWLPKLHTLHASRNKLVSLPRNLGNLLLLRDLRLDWNQITELPFSFRQLTSLQTFCMERNPMKLPPMDYITKGIQATMLYMERSLEEFIRKARRQVVEKVIEMLTVAMQIVDALHAKPQPLVDDQEKQDLEILDANFEPRVERIVAQTEKLPFFAVVWGDSFYETVLPIIERRSPMPLELLKLCSPQEIEDALHHYDDFFGPASMLDAHSEFRRCSCIDETEWQVHGVKKRRVCVPGQVPFRCQRKALLVRMTMMTKDQAKDQMASTYLTTKIARLKNKTKAKCVAYINSETGILFFEKLTKEMAKRHCLRRKQVKKLKANIAKEKMKLDKKKNALQAKLGAFQKAKETWLKSQQEKLDKLKKERTALAIGGEGESKNAKKLAKLDGKIGDLETQLLSKDSVEEAKILQVEVAIEALDHSEKKAQDAFDKAKEAAMNDGESLSPADGGGGGGGSATRTDDKDEDGDSDEPEDSDEEGEEEEEEEEEDDKEAEEEQAAPLSIEQETTADAAPPPQSFFTIEMPDLHVQDYRRVANNTIEKSLGEDQVVNEEELVVLYQQHLRDAYVAEKCALVEKKVTYEFLQMRAVLKRWMGHGTRVVFAGWREVVVANRANAEQIKQKAIKKRQIEAQNAVLADQLVRLEAHKWVHRVDMYTDQVYYEHSDTGETSWTPPMYWQEEQEDEDARRGAVEIPLLKLPPI